MPSTQYKHKRTFARRYGLLLGIINQPGATDAGKSRRLIRFSDAGARPVILAPGNDPENEAGKPVRLDRPKAGREDLPYKVELWDDARQRVNQVLAVTASASIGYAAYYAATREYPDRYITLRHKSSVVSRWNGPRE